MKAEFNTNKEKKEGEIVKINKKTVLIKMNNEGESKKGNRKYIKRDLHNTLLVGE